MLEPVLIASTSAWYALTMLLAVLVAAIGLRTTQRRLPLMPEQKWGLGLGAFVGAMLGSKLPFVLGDWESLVSGATWMTNGKSIMFGIVGGYLGVELTKWCLQINVRTGDSFAAPLPFAVAIGRIACFVAGCCYGTPTGLPWGVHFSTADGDDMTIFRHPTQLYEALFHTLMGFLMWRLAIRLRKVKTGAIAPQDTPAAYPTISNKRNHAIWRSWLEGNLIKLYLVCYLAYRFFTEFIRPESRLIAGLTGYQLGSIVLLIVFAGIWYYDVKRHSMMNGHD
jgi:phosphatidylglycerol---prolipoprotein diacylglyceryl transferase